MSCEEMRREKEKKLKRKLTAEEKAEIMEKHNHSQSEIEEETGIVYA